MSTDTCPSCGAGLAPNSDPCPGCGALPTKGETLELPAEPVLPDPRVTASSPERPPTVHLVHRQPMGVHPVPLLGGLGGLSLLLAIVLLATGGLVAGLVLLALATGLLTMCRFAIRREPEAPAAQQALRMIDRCGSAVGLVTVGLRTGSRAGWQLVRIRTRQWQLRTALHDRLGPLGEAAHRDDHARVQALKQEATELEQRLRSTEQEASAILGAARREIRRERAAGEATEVLPRVPG